MLERVFYSQKEPVLKALQRTSFLLRFIAFVGVLVYILNTYHLYGTKPVKSFITGYRSGNVTEVREVYKPLARPQDACQVTLMEHSFSGSYGKLFVGAYRPPPTKCNWTHAIFSVSFVSKGFQFDGLALLFFDDVEIWRMSTAEPTQLGIYWEYHKDMTQYRTLLRKEGKIIMELENGNPGNPGNAGIFNGTLKATYYIKKEEKERRAPDEVLPLSKRKSAHNQPSAFSIPRDNASTAIFLPKNNNFSKAIISLTANGNADEEFWYNNVPTHLKYTFRSPLTEHSAFREVQLLLDGQLVGVAWPFPVIFPGGFAPSLWRPIVGIATFDLVEDEIDVTPWLHVFADGDAHIWELRVVGVREDGWKDNGNPKYVIGGHVGNHWIVSGRLLLWSSTSAGSLPTTAVSMPKIVHGTTPSVHIAYELNQDPYKHGNLSLVVTMSVQRVITTSYAGMSTSHTLSFSSTSHMTNDGLNQTVDQYTQSSFHYSSAFGSEVLRTEYPLNVTNNIIWIKRVSVADAAVDRAMYRHRFVEGDEEGRERSSMKLETRQNGTSTYYAGARKPVGVDERISGTTEQAYSLTTPGGEYLRHVKVAWGTVVLFLSGSVMVDDSFTVVDRIWKTDWYDSEVKGSIGRYLFWGRLELMKANRHVDMDKWMYGDGN